METIYSLRPLVAVLIASVASILIMATRNRPNLRETWSVLGAVATCLTVTLHCPELEVT